jgi:outer membrane immunogenic protein
MKSLLLGATILSSVAMFTSIASAADAVVEEVAVVDVAPSLTGFYAGLAVGYQWGDFDTDGYLLTLDPEIAFLTSGKGKDGGTGGVYAGYNWDLGNQWLVGVEADANFIAAGKNDNWMGSLRARGGYIFNGDTLLYATGGLAFGEIGSGGSDFAPIFGGSISVDNSVQAGWTVGAGVEHWFSDKVSAKFEYVYTDLGDVETWNALGLGEVLSSDLTSSTVRAGIALHF